jgi:putative FmdB family regulatory protein
MPLYEYKCPNGHLFEAIHGMTEPSPEACEVCGASPLQRVLYPVAVHYKGSGFYSTDYGRKGKAAAKEKEAGGSSSDGGSATSTPSEGSSSGSDSGSGSGETKKAAEA